MTNRNQAGVVTCPSCEGLIRPDGSCRCGENAFPLIGSVLGGSVRLDGILGAGGMGRVYEGFDLSLHRRVAVKVLDRAAPAEVKERFAREGRSLASLEHPNVVSVHAAGVSPEGTPFIVMKLLEAKTLNDWSGAAPLPADKVLPVLRQVASAIDALHSRGIIHRDIKPANVMIDEAGKVTLVDLGVALGNGPRLTQVGLVVGTVDFMSPEQMAGEPLSPATDLYALGLLTSELLVGPRRLSLRDREQELAARFSGRMPRIDALNPAITPDVALVVQRALAPGAKDRFQTAGAFLAAFESALTEPSARTLEQPAFQRPRSRSRLLLIVSILAAIGVGGVAVWRLSGDERASDSNPITVPDVQSEVVAQQDAASLRVLGMQLRVLPAVTATTEARVSFGSGLVQAVAAARVTDELVLHRSRQLEREAKSIDPSDDQRLELARLANWHARLLERQAVALGELRPVARALESVPSHARAALLVRQAHALEGVSAPAANGVTEPEVALLDPERKLGAVATERLRKVFETRVDRGGLDTVLAVQLEFRARGPSGGLEALLARAPQSRDVDDWRATMLATNLNELPERTPPLIDGEAAGVLGKFVDQFVDNNSVVDDVTIGEFRREVRDGQSIETMLERMSTSIGSNSEKRELFETKLSQVRDGCLWANTRLKLLNCDDDVRRLHTQFYRFVD